MSRALQSVGGMQRPNGGLQPWGITSRSEKGDRAALIRRLYPMGSAGTGRLAEGLDSSLMRIGGPARLWVTSDDFARAADTGGGHLQFGLVRRLAHLGVVDTVRSQGIPAVHIRLDGDFLPGCLRIGLVSRIL